MRCSIVASADQVDDVTGRGLVLAPGAGDALLELGRIPRQIEIHDHAGGLEVQAEAAGVRGEEQAAVRIALEAADLRAPLRCGTEPVCHANPKLIRRASRAPVRACAPIPRTRSTFTPRRRGPRALSPTRRASGSRAARIEDVGRVAKHPHAGEPRLQRPELLARQGGAAPRRAAAPRDLVAPGSSRRCSGSSATKRRCRPRDRAAGSRPRSCGGAAVSGEAPAAARSRFR